MFPRAIFQPPRNHVHCEKIQAYRKVPLRCATNFTVQNIKIQVSVAVLMVLVVMTLAQLIHYVVMTELCACDVQPTCVHNLTHVDTSLITGDFSAAIYFYLFSSVIHSTL